MAGTCRYTINLPAWSAAITAIFSKQTWPASSCWGCFRQRCRCVDAHEPPSCNVSQPRRSGLPLDRMVQDANRIFCESTLAGQFATLVVGRAAHDGSVEFVSAGHLPVLHIHGDGATPKDSTGVPLGCSVTPLPVHRLTLTHGDTLFLYTDGLTEARNRAGARVWSPPNPHPGGAARRDRACWAAL